jgi:hypothetical protein
MTDREWIAGFAERLGVEPPGDEDIERILRLAAEAAHASERTAAPVACWLAAWAGVTLDAALAQASQVA